jgi:hypothetical protein
MITIALGLIAHPRGNLKKIVRGREVRKIMWKECPGVL